MKKIHLLPILMLLLTMQTAFAQKKEKVDEKSKHYFKEPNDIDKTDYKVSFKNIVSTFEYLKFAVVITNKTDDFIIWDNRNSKVVMDWGEKSTSKPDTYDFKPYDSANKTFHVEGGDQFLVKNFKMILNGVSKVPTNGRVQNVPEFKLPAQVNSITAGNFTISLKDIKKKTDETYVHFEVMYNGDDVAVVNVNELSARVNQNDIYASDVKKTMPSLLHKGEKMAVRATFHIPTNVADMQFADMFVLFNKAFSESKPIPLSGGEVSFELDEALTKEKN
jgi:hypothetical protein